MRTQPRRQSRRAAPTHACVLSLAVATAESIKVPEARAAALYHIALAWAKAGDFDKAIETTNTIDPAAGSFGLPSSRAEALAWMAVAQAEADGSEQANKTFAAALDIAKTIENPGDRAWTFAEIAAARAVAGAFDAAFDIVNRTGVANTGLNMPRASALSASATEQAVAGDIDGALKTAQTIDHYEFDDSAVRNIAQAQAEAGDIDGAFKTAQMIEHPYRRAEALRVIARELSRPAVSTTLWQPLR